MPQSPATEKAGQTTIGAMVAGFNPTQGRGPWEKVGPIIALLVLVTIKVFVAFEVFNSPEALQGVTDILTLAVGGWAGRLGAK